MFWICFLTLRLASNMHLSAFLVCIWDGVGLSLRFSGARSWLSPFLHDVP
jgi:hypothetical protein